MNLDAQNQLILRSETSIAVMGNGGEDFTLIPLTAGPIEDGAKEAKNRGFHLCGIVGVRDGRIDVVSEPHNAPTMLKAVLAFISERAEPKGDAVEWLKALHRLSDPRP